MGVTGQHQHATIGGGDVHVDHLHGGELLQGSARAEAWGICVQLPAEGDMQAIGEEGDEDVRLDALLMLVVDGADGQIAFEMPERRL